ncbi:LOW QUALITY PROTEIN: small integral membrane protein 27 [Rhynchonycteris naso]
MKRVSRRTLDWIYSVLLLAIVLLSWGYIIYASTVAAGRQLRKKYPDKIYGMNENFNSS